LIEFFEEHSFHVLYTFLIQQHANGDERRQIMADIVKEIHHTGITVRNLEESVAFYDRVFGFKHVGGCELKVDQEGEMEGVQINIAFLQAGDDSFELLEYAHPKTSKYIEQNPWQPGVQHVSFKISDIRSFYDKHKDSVHFLSAPIDYRTEGIDTTWVYLRDINGTLIELSQDHMERSYRK
jgi:catechol 2,3-dioxygenase-like lactoylglutathione lyase family enzyme